MQSCSDTRTAATVAAKAAVSTTGPAAALSPVSCAENAALALRTFPSCRMVGLEARCARSSGGLGNFQHGAAA